MEKVKFEDVKIGDCICEKKDKRGELLTTNWLYIIYLVKGLNEKSKKVIRSCYLYLYLDINFSFVDVFIYNSVDEANRGKDDGVVFGDIGSSKYETYRLNEQEKMKYYTKPAMLKELG